MQYNLMIVSHEDDNELLFFDADTLEHLRTVSYEGYPYKIFKFNGQYFVFGNGSYVSIPVGAN